MSDKQLGKLVFDTSHRMKNMLNGLVSANIPEMSGVQFRLLGFIQRCSNEGITVFQKDIEKELRLKGSSVTSLLNNLESNGYISRQAVRTDKRKNAIVLTKKSEELHLRMSDILSNFEKTVSEGFSEEERDLFISLLEKLSDNIDKAKE